MITRWKSFWSGSIPFPSLTKVPVIHSFQCYRSTDSQGQGTDVSRIIHVTIKLHAWAHVLLKYLVLSFNVIVLQMKSCCCIVQPTIHLYYYPYAPCLITWHCASLKTLWVLFLTLTDVLFINKAGALWRQAQWPPLCCVSFSHDGTICVLRCGIVRLRPLGVDGGCHGNHRPGAPHTWHAEQAGGGMEPHCEYTLTCTSKLKHYCLVISQCCISKTAVVADIVTVTARRRRVHWGGLGFTKLKLMKSNKNSLAMYPTHPTYNAAPLLTSSPPLSIPQWPG